MPLPGAQAIGSKSHNRCRRGSPHRPKNRPDFSQTRLIAPCRAQAIQTKCGSTAFMYRLAAIHAYVKAREKWSGPVRM